MGSSVGPALANQLIKSLGRDRVSVQGVDYTASVASNALRGSEGGKVMAQLANAQAQRCPNSKIAISGYSQGAMVVHYAVKSADLSPSKVSSAVVYGDPQNRESAGNLPAAQTKVSRGFNQDTLGMREIANDSRRNSATGVMAFVRRERSVSLRLTSLTLVTEASLKAQASSSSRQVFDEAWMLLGIEGSTLARVTPFAPSVWNRVDFH